VQPAVLVRLGRGHVADGGAAGRSLVIQRGQAGFVHFTFHLLKKALREAKGGLPVFVIGPRIWGIRGR